MSGQTLAATRLRWDVALQACVRLALAVAFATGLSYAQSCSALVFEGAASASLKPGETSHVVLLRQDDGSYTAVELTDTSPYRIISTRPNFQKFLIRGQALPATGHFPGQLPPEVITRLESGGYLWVRATYPGLNVVLFHSELEFVSEVQYPMGSGASVEQITVHDVNGDGILDIVAGTAFPHNVALQVLLGSGGASFQAPVTYPVLSSSLFVNSMGVVDVNGDAKPDVVMASSIGGPLGGISVFLGNGDGTFQAERTVLSHLTAWFIAVADLNADGKPDLAYSVQGGADFGYGPIVAVAMGNGDGTFGEPVRYAVGSIGPIAIGDMDGDGNPDLVATGFTILHGDGQGRFPHRADYWQDTAGDIFLADFDGDGKTDIVVGIGSANAITGSAVAVLFAQGGGLFAGPRITPVSGLPDANNAVYGLAAADLDGDGHPDLVVQQLGRINVLIGNADGTFHETFRYLPTAGFPTAIAIADVNGDAKPDIVATIDSFTSARIEVFLGNGDGTFRGPVATPSPKGLYRLAVTDLNGDGKPDVTVLLNTIEGAQSDQLLVFLGTGTGSFASYTSYYVGVRPSSLALGDFNRDGKPDLVVALSGDPTSPGGMRILLGKGDGSFAAPAAVPLSADNPAAFGIAAGDLDRDGKPDLAVSVSGNRLLVLPGNGDGTFGAPVSYKVSESFVPSIADLNDDGIPDVLNGFRPSWLLGNGDGTLQEEIYFAPSSHLSLIVPVAADFNGDGRIDLAGGLSTEGVTTLLAVACRCNHGPGGSNQPFELQ